MHYFSSEQKIYRFLSLLFFCFGIFLITYSHELGFFRGFFSDVLIVCFIFTCIRSFKNLRTIPLIGFILIFCITVEVLQYFEILEILGWTGNPLARILLGSVFDPLDIGAYALGGLLVYVFDRFIFPSFSHK